MRFSVPVIVLSVALTAGIVLPLQPVAREAAPEPVICRADVAHPLSVSVEAVGSVERGRSLTARIEVTSRLPLDNAAVRVTSSGGTELLGPATVELGAIGVDRPVVADVTVRVPEDGHRFLLQFDVVGDHDGVGVRRGAALNLLPDGPAQIGESVERADGTKILQVPARRIDR